MSGIKQPNDLSGESGLLVAVIKQAVRDAVSARVAAEHRESAWRYLASESYRHDLQVLGLPSGWIPERIETEAKAHGT